MTVSKRMELLFASILLLASGIVFADNELKSVVDSLLGGDEEESTFNEWVDSEGNIRLPEDFRLNLVHLGSFFVPEGDASGFHDVYTEAETVKHYRETGEFPDGATLVKHLVDHKSATYTTGANVKAETTTKLWFVMVKDTEGRFEDNPVWGDGWGWALIKTDDPNVNTATNYETDCKGCHVPAQQTDWIYVEDYPTLRSE